MHVKVVLLKYLARRFLAGQCDPTFLLGLSAGGEQKPVDANFNSRCEIASDDRAVSVNFDPPSDQVAWRSSVWRQYACNENVARRGRCLVLADVCKSRSRQLVYDLSILGFDVDVRCGQDALSSVLQFGPGWLWSLLVVDLDFLTTELSIREVEEGLLCLRRNVDHLPVILVSNEPYLDESDASSMSVTDAILTFPVSLRRLRLGVWEARASNVNWRTWKEWVSAI